MGAGFRRIVRRVMFGGGMLLIGIALAAMIANQFRVVYLSQHGAAADRRVRFERGVIRYVSMSGSTQVLRLPPGLTAVPTASAPNTIAVPTGSNPGRPRLSWGTTIVKRFSRHDAAFGPYEWLPRHTNDGSAASLSVPWWMLGAIGGLLACAGFWGIRTPRGHCRKCEYDLRGLPAGASVCPECGAKLPAASAPPSASPCESSTSAHA